MTREEWLQNAIAKLRVDFASHGASYPENLRVSVGWPGGRGSRLKTIGEYWQARASADEVPCIFISPILGEPIRALDVLVHELIHAAKPNAGHGKEFKRLALALGLEGKMTATIAGERLKQRLNTLLAELGPYPHAELKPSQRPGKSQTTRLLKAECACGYTCRVTKKWADIGAPICPTCMDSMEVESGNEN